MRLGVANFNFSCQTKYVGMKVVTKNYPLDNNSHFVTIFVIENNISIVTPKLELKKDRIQVVYMNMIE